MSIDELCKKHKDNYIGTGITCPVCGKVFKKTAVGYCSGCSTLIFDRDKDGYTLLIDPVSVDKSRRYKVSGAASADGEYYPGELVTVTVPFMTDCNVQVRADDAELCLSGDKAAFLMPQHDVTVTVTRVNAMANTAPQFFGNAMGMMNMGMSDTKDKDGD